MVCILMLILFVTFRCSQSQDSEEDINVLLDKLINLTNNPETYKEDRKNAKNSKIYYLKPSPDIISRVANQISKHKTLVENDGFVADGILDMADPFDADDTLDNNESNDINVVQRTSDITVSIDHNSETVLMSSETEQHNDISQLNSNNNIDNAEIAYRSLFSDNENNLLHRYPEIIIDKIAKIANDNLKQNPEVIIDKTTKINEQKPNPEVVIDKVTKIDDRKQYPEVVIDKITKITNNHPKQYPEVIIDKITKLEEQKSYPEVVIDKVTKIANDHPMQYPEVIIDKITKIDERKQYPEVIMGKITKINDRKQYPEVVIDKVTKIAKDHPKQYPEVIINKITKIEERKPYPEVVIDKVTKIANDNPMQYPEMIIDKITKIDDRKQYPEVVIDKITNIANNHPKPYPEVIIDKITKIEERKPYPEIVIDKVTKIANDHPMQYPQVIIDKIAKIVPPHLQSEKGFRENENYVYNPKDSNAYAHKIEIDLAYFKKLRDKIRYNYDLQDEFQNNNLHHLSHHAQTNSYDLQDEPYYDNLQKGNKYYKVHDHDTYPIDEDDDISFRMYKPSPSYPPVYDINPPIFSPPREPPISIEAPIRPCVNPNYPNPCAVMLNPEIRPLSTILPGYGGLNAHSIPPVMTYPSPNFLLNQNAAPSNNKFWLLKLLQHKKNKNLYLQSLYNIGLPRIVYR